MFPKDNSMGSRVMQTVRRVVGFLTIILTTVGDCQVQFSNVTQSAGTFYFGESWGASWGDINGDALPDLFVSNHRMLPSLQRNNGDGTFTNIARQVDGSGTWFNNPLYDQHGGTWTDFDADGDQDLTIATGTCCAPQFLTNNNGIEFIDETVSRGIVDDGGGRMPFFFDYNRDNRIDLALMNSGTTKLMRQKSDGNFVLVGNSSSGFKCTGFRSNYSQLSDLDDDIALGGTMEAMCMRDGLSPARVYDTESLPFRDITSSSPSERSVVDTIIGDFDGNLLPDIFMLRGGLRFNQAIKASATYVEARLQANSGSQRELSFSASGTLEITFYSITTAKQGSSGKIFIGADGSHPDNGSKFSVNPNNSSHWGIKPHTPGSENRLYVGYDVGSSKWSIQLSAAPDNGSRGYIIIKAANSIGQPTITPLLAVDKAMPPKMHMNTGGGFQQEAASRGFGGKIACVSGVAADFDKDMDLDLYFACRGGAENLVNRLYLNDGQGNFSLVNNAGGAGGVTGVTLFDRAGVSDSVVTADYDVDGNMDIFVTNGLNLQPFRKGGGPNQLFRNITSNSNHWIELDLVGTTSNRDAVGAKVYATVGEGASEVTQLRQQNGGYHRWSQNHQRIHFGLGQFDMVNITVHWPSGLEESHEVAADRLYRVIEGGDILPVNITPPDPQGSECGEPDYDKATEKGLFVWKDCTVTNTEKWVVRVTGGGSSSVINYRGSVESDQDLSNVEHVSFESSDVLDTGNKKKIDYLMKVINAGYDGFSFEFDPSAQVCFNPFISLPGDSVYLGAGRTKRFEPINLVTLEDCTAAPVNNPECGKPSYNRGSDKSLFLWKDCVGTGRWHLRVTAGGSPTTIAYRAEITSSEGFTGVTERISIESNDTVDDVTDPNKIDLELKLKKRGEDGIEFGFPAGANTCFRKGTFPEGAQVRLGADKVLIPMDEFDLDTQGACL